MSWGPVVARFDDLIHVPTRLRITAALAATTELEFGALEASLGISTSLLSKHLRLLADARYVVLEKRPQPFGRPRTWIRLTPGGRTAYLGHVAALRELLEVSPGSGGGDR
ncbi:transcriptional regulator [Raineyella sp. W15-4]|uniref:transcriptional regulator n=1 Tax=Raineyella sp. W15-4 TaxID=3081651 RepID=UPI0029555DC5|nr:transcriptional regulator [Raineyella sp. W15-4]WOQ16908.1 transcriptional regulator [Raineyella sp. W15-4]